MWRRREKTGTALYDESGCNMDMTRRSPGCGSQRLLRCRLHPAGRGPNSSSLFPPLALGLRLLLFLQPLGGDFEKAERCPSLASLHLPLAAVGSATVVAVALPGRALYFHSRSGSRLAATLRMVPKMPVCRLFFACSSLAA